LSPCGSADTGPLLLDTSNNLLYVNDLNYDDTYDVQIFSTATDSFSSTLCTGYGCYILDYSPSRQISSGTIYGGCPTSNDICAINGAVMTPAPSLDGCSGPHFSRSSSILYNSATKLNYIGSCIVNSTSNTPLASFTFSGEWFYNLVSKSIEAVSGQTIFKVADATYPITFSETGLPANNVWNLNFNNTPFVVTTSVATPTFYGSGFPSHTFSWNVPFVQIGSTRYSAAPASGNMVVPTQTNQNLAFSPS
jgi:hypothetical protein